MKVKKEILRYKPFNDQEREDKKIILNYIDIFDDCLTRQNEIGHFTSSAWILNKKRDKVLFIYHNIYNSWGWVGGHADGEEDLLKTAIREAKEETGLDEVYPISEDIFSLEILAVDSHYKKGKFIASHIHLNVTYLLEADEASNLKVKEDENSAVKWFYINDAINASNEECMKKIYLKLEDKTKRYLSDN